MDRGLERLTPSQLEMLIDQSGVNIFSVDREFRYTFFTTEHARTMQEMWGVEVSVGMDVIGDVIQEDQDRKKAKYNFSWAAAGNDFTVLEPLGYSRSRRLFENRYRPTRAEDGIVVGVTASMLDASERIQLADAQRGLDRKLIEASQLTSLGLLVGCVAHDFNNLLLPILLNAELALTSIDPQHSVAALLGEVVASVNCAGELAKQLQSFGRSEVIGKNLIDLNTIVESVADLARIAICRRAELTRSLDTIPLLINANPTQLRQVIVNLLTNASEATRGERLHITLETSSICLTEPTRTQRMFPSEIPEGNYGLVTIHDNGCGMSEEQLERIFQPFYSTKGTGRGLGLTAVQCIMEDHNGFLAIDSTLGVGSTFRIGFPIAVANAESCVQEDGPADVELRQPSQPRRVLIVADNQDSLRAMSNVCKKLGHDVGTVTHNVVVFSAMITQPFDVILLDADMGEAFSQRIVDSIPDSVKTPVIVISAETQPATLVYKTPVHSILRKPFSMENLSAALQRIEPQSAGRFE